MSGFSSFAVWGAGNLGKQLVQELLSYKEANPDIRVTVLARPESIGSEKNTELTAQGAQVVPWDPASHDASNSLKDIDVFICSASGRAAPLQIPAAHAAGKAGVKLFVPNDWGNDIFAGETPWHKAQQAARHAAKEANIAVTSFFCGFWPDVLFRFGYDLEHGKIDISGDGKTPMSLTSVHDVARFAAYALVNLPKDTVVGRNFQIQGDYTTPLEIAAGLGAVTSKPIEVTHTSIEELQAIRADGQAKGDFMQVLMAGFRLNFATGGCQLKGNLDNALWAEWKPARAVDVLKRELLGEERYISDAAARGPVTQAERDIASK